MIRFRAVSSLCAAAIAVVLAGPAAGAPPAPSLVMPNDGVVLDALPGFGWTPVAGADKYEWEIAADGGFNSPVLGGTHDHFFTKNTRATMTKVVPNGTYWWRVRAIGKDGSVSPWSASRTITKNWASAPTLQRPANGAAITYPEDPFRLSWSAVPGAASYLVSLATDPSLGSPLASVETQATSFTLSAPLTPDQTYYWGIVPLDAAGNRGEASPVWRFTWRWPSTTTPQVTDVASAVEIYDHRFSWAPVLGAAGYEVEVNTSSDFAPGSKVCCPVAPLTRRTTIGTSYSPTLVLPNNNTYYWRVRALDASGNAGVWNEGPTFRKAFDDVLPSVKNLRMLDNATPPVPDFATSTPIVAWDPVPGASSYEVEVVPYVGGGCQWTWPREQHWTSSTSATTWTPLGSGWNRVKPFQTSFSVSSDAPSLVAGNSYCVRVTALDRPSDSVSRHIRSAETYLPDSGAPAFRWLGPPSGGACTPSCNAGAPGSDDYLLPVRGGTIRQMSLFRWKPLAGYESYFVLVARDPEFTNVVDYAFTQIPAYAPRAQTGPRTYSDETTLYYWAILPATGRDGSGVVTAPRFAAASNFHKQSIPPTLLAPTDGTVFTGVPTFHWAPAEGARRYRLQVSQDPSFSAPLKENVLTDSTSYTSAATYPPDTNLYWRVSADAESVDVAADVALTWSRTGVFRKTLAAPIPDPGNPTSGDAVPTWQWSVVPGAVSYDFALDFPNGSSRLFEGVPAAAATPVVLKGTGIWKWRVRAKFPQVATSSLTEGPWSATQSFTRTIREPGGGQEDAQPGRVLLQWATKTGALNYRVQISTREDFSTFVQRSTTENTSFAPLMTVRAYDAGGTFYWRVAAADDAVANVGDFSAARSFTLAGGTIKPRATSRVSGFVRVARRAISVTGTVTPAHPRSRVSVVLQRKRGAAYVRVAGKAPRLTAASRFTTSFRRPRAGACRLIVRFAGDAHHLPSSAIRRFRC